MKIRRPRSSPDNDDGYGRVYIFRFELDDGTTVWKVGMCNSDRVNDRFMEVITSFHTTYRYVPRCSIRKYKKCVAPLLVEKHLHYLLDEYRFTFDKKFSGSTEMFTDIDEGTLIDYLSDIHAIYKELLRVDSMNTLDYSSITRELASVDRPSEGTDSLNF